MCKYIYIYTCICSMWLCVCVSMYVYSCTFFTKNTQISAYLRYSKCLCFWRVFSPYNRNCTTLSILPLSAFWSGKKSEDGHERARFLAQVSTKSRNEHKFKQKLLQAEKNEFTANPVYSIHIMYIMRIYSYIILPIQKTTSDSMVDPDRSQWLHRIAMSLYWYHPSWFVLLGFPVHVHHLKKVG